MALLELSGVTKQFGGLTAVNNVTFNVEAGSIFGLIGPNGAGKTTLLNCLAGLIRPNAGTIHFDGHDTTGLPGRADVPSRPRPDVPDPAPVSRA